MESYITATSGESEIGNNKLIKEKLLKGIHTRVAVVISSTVMSGSDKNKIETNGVTKHVILYENSIHIYVLVSRVRTALLFLGTRTKDRMFCPILKPHAFWDVEDETRHGTTFFLCHPVVKWFFVVRKNFQ